MNMPEIFTQLFHTLDARRAFTGTPGACHREKHTGTHQETHRLGGEQFRTRYCEIAACQKETTSGNEAPSKAWRTAFRATSGMTRPKSSTCYYTVRRRWLGRTRRGAREFPWPGEKERKREPRVIIRPDRTLRAERRSRIRDCQWKSRSWIRREQRTLTSQHARVNRDSGRPIANGKVESFSLRNDEYRSNE